MREQKTYNGPEALENARSLALFGAAALSCCLAAPAWIVLAALRSDWTGLAAASALTLLGFLGAPLAWRRFARLTALSRLVRLIVGEGVTSVSELAARLRISPRRALGQIRWLLNTRFLMGYVLWGETEVLTKERADGRRLSDQLFGK